MGGMLEVRALAGLALVQDAGRGHRAAGVPSSGAFDRHAHACATGLVGGGPEQAGVELVGQVTLVASVPITAAVTGPAQVQVAGRTVPTWTAFDAPAGAEVVVVTPRRACIALAGGLQVPPVLGSRCTCLLGPLGPPPLAAGDRLPLAAVSTATTAGDFVRPPEHTGPIHVVPGPHVALPPGPWRVVESTRIGIRVRPAEPVAGVTSTLPSLGVLPGTIQALPSGDCVVLGPDAGTMGGYPVAGVVCTADLDRLAVAFPGDVLDLAEIGAEQAPTPPVVAIVRVDALPG
jgi:allophanate hydrolase subunit 2